MGWLKWGGCAELTVLHFSVLLFMPGVLGFLLSLNNADLLGRVLQGHGGIACRSKSEWGK